MIRVLLALLLLTAVVAAPATAGNDPGPEPTEVAAFQEGGDGHGASGERRDGLSDMVIWSLVGLAVFSAVFGALYFFKRQVGGFPENPSWVAPITIMPSKDFPGEGDFGDQAASAHAQPEH